MVNQGGGGTVAVAQIPTSFGHELRACLRCRLVKTYDQVGSTSMCSHSYVFFLLLLFLFINCYYSNIFTNFWQFRESGCENCPFFQMEDDHERVVDCTTPNFTGCVSLLSSPLSLKRKA